MIFSISRIVFGTLTILLLGLSGCARLYYPQLPGPADDLTCIIERTGGNLTGHYHCDVKGQYILKDHGWHL